MRYDTSEMIPQGARVCIYGCGLAGLKTKRMLESRRPDVRLVCFLDSDHEGTVDHTAVVNVGNIASLAGRYDLILVASAFWRQIVGNLKRLDLDYYLVVDPVAPQ